MQDLPLLVERAAGIKDRSHYLRAFSRDAIDRMRACMLSYSPSAQPEDGPRSPRPRARERKVGPSGVDLG